MKKRVQESIRKIQTELAKKPEILAAYLFGSTIKGYNRPNSDLDIAILVQPSFEIKDYHYQIELKDKLNSLIDNFKVDLIVVNYMELPLQYSSVIEGTLIYSKDNLGRAREEIKISNRYEDLKDFYELRRKSNLKAAKGSLKYV